MTAIAVPVPAAVRAATCAADQLPQLARALLVELVEAVPPAQSASVVTLAGPRLRPWASSGAPADELDQLQAAVGDGPVFLAAADDELVVSDDLARDPRWGLAARPGTSLVAVALPGAATARAVLTVLGDGPGLVDPAVVASVTGAVPDLAAAVAVVQARLEAANLQLALASNRTIGAAIGVAMAAHKLPYDEAAALLRSLSNHTNTRLIDLAEQVLLTGEVPDPPQSAAPRPRRPGGATGGR
ncbi:ANTAR domain-containing protein [Klenkia marina]|uniref:ANTAR domain-containing protein n=1 Tax=Klenkia marina TaxID=1960309 RepID=A0A1G4XQB8_9ACTN|nr:ANTAR domain-containing protein [Klenkia marina]SCX43423.1 ANTAR domain-containing protein [Klenkia marina]